MTKPFVHLHNHTEFSMLDGMGPVETKKDNPDRVGYVNKAVELGMPALAITDHGNLCGAPEFYHACRKQGIEPILGEEFYFVEDVNYRAKKGEPTKERYHVVMLAKGAKGFEVLSELSTEANRNFYGKPIIDHNTLEHLGKDAKHLVVLSGCANSIISQHVRSDDMDAAAGELMWWRETFKHFWIELQHHDTDFDRSLNAGLLTLAQTYSVPWVVTNDPHYVVPEDDCHHDALLAIQTASNIDDPERFRFDGHGYHLRSRQEMFKVFKKHYGTEVWKPGAAQTLRIAELCHTRIPGWEKRQWQIPNYPKADGEDTNKLLRRLAFRGLRKRGLRDRPEYVERVEHELSVFKEVGIADFLLITMDIIQAAVAMGVRVGPGRGSVCGSLVGYLIGIHKVDSVKYDLLFERFLNPARPRMPDIDSDLAQSGRDKLYDYVVDLFGDENCVHVAAYQRMQLKAAFQSLARAHGIPFNESIKISKTLEDVDDLPEHVVENYPDLAEQVRRLAGIKRSVSNHPAGIVIAAPEANLRKQVPQMWIPSSKRWVGMYDLDAIEELGLMKQDLLGLRTLDTIDWCVRFLAERGVELEPDDWSPDDESGDQKVYKMLGKGKTAGVFQMEGYTNTRGIREIKPTCFEDIVSCTSLYRTGAIAAGFPKVFLKNRRGGTVEFIHPSLEPILGHTQGVVLYQEQVMEMGRSLAGFSMVEVDDIKEAIKHKKSTLMQEMKPKFIKGCMRKVGMTKKQATEAWRYIEGYAGYGYNRSHAVAYTLLTYQTARLKRLHPHEFWAAHLRTVDQSADSGKEKRDVYLREAVDAGFKILPPHINKSDEGARPEGKKGIRFGLTDIAGVGAKAAERLLAARSELRGGKFRTVEEVAAASNKRTLEALMECGALECLGVEFTEARRDELVRWQFKDPMKKWRRKVEHLVTIPDDTTMDVRITLAGQITSVSKRTTKSGKPFVTWKIHWSTNEAFTVQLWSGTELHWQLKPGSIVMVKGFWEPKWQNVSVSNARMVRVLHEEGEAA